MTAASRGHGFRIEWISAMTASCWEVGSCSQCSNKSNCFGVNSRSALSEKNCESVIPNAMQIFSRDVREGSISLRYQDEMVDWGMPERTESWYSVQPRARHCSVILSR